MSDIRFYAVGLVHVSACAPGDASTEEIEGEAGIQHPTGLDHGWKVSDAPTFSGGEPNPCVCNTDPDRRHYLLDC